MKIFKIISLFRKHNKLENVKYKDSRTKPDWRNEIQKKFFTDFNFNKNKISRKLYIIYARCLKSSGCRNLLNSIGFLIFNSNNK